jgi:hypothetical protein
MVLAGRLPDRAPERVWGGKGCGAACAVCGVRLTLEEAELELEFAPLGERGTQAYNLHPRCFAIWDSVRRELESERSASTVAGLPGIAAERTLPGDEREAPLP